MYTRETFDAASAIVGNPVLANKLRTVLLTIACVQTDGEVYSNQRFDLKQNLAALLNEANNVLPVVNGISVVAETRQVMEAEADYDCPGDDVQSLA